MQTYERVDLEKAADKKTAASKARCFVSEAQAIWAEKDIVKKRHLLLTTMVDHFTYRKKERLFETKVANCVTGDQLDRLAKEIMLWGEGLAVLRW